jgi:ABC-2 type transport system permease protein
MFTNFRHTLRRFRGQILGWGIGLGSLGVYVVYFYNTMLAQREQWETLMESFPPEMMAFFGGMTDLISPEGYLNGIFFSYMPIVLGTFAILAGSGLLAADEENGTLDLILAHPISRAALFVGRFLAFTVATTAILALTWLFSIGTLPFSELPVTPGELALPFISLFAVILLFGCLALLFSMILPSRSMAATLSGLLLVTAYIVDSLQNLSDGPEWVAGLNPLHYFQSADAMAGLNWAWLGGLLAVGLLLTLLAYLLFQQRDIRVGGEGGWNFPLMPWRKPQQSGE